MEKFSDLRAMSSESHRKGRAVRSKTRISTAISITGATLVTVLGLVLSGCESVAPTLVDGKPGMPVTAAYFAQDPSALMSAAQAACRNPGEEFVRPQPGVAQCRLLLDPETTAAVILQFDGAIHDLPQLVVSLSSARAGKGYVVSGCAFLKVPRKNGNVVRVVQSDRAIDAKLREMLTAVGGKPLRDVPRDVAERCFSL